MIEPDVCHGGGGGRALEGCVGRFPVLPCWDAKERCLTWFKGWVGISHAARIRCWGQDGGKYREWSTHCRN